ncbi:hypothetical protein [Ligilactobacillus salivarius]|uniref:hypothetical protein n=1 Tax=Ligilactobacillus salivarius TaxID=1624 RepID=UPI000BAEF4BD|nr:hypothetical protein [Ligilactobacillus salivarius]PAY33899.1 hypothetical protein A8C54_09565 [Ligilactobacillus salivarius]PAY52786.1 hypothetical protein A8C43_01375 [Ligilactobacillus salivarius]PAY55190.1 hypothetical protein A8C46_10335 [Ligilactobacillus salivarius]UXI84059.1 hypothetical protein NYZ94_08685 [Ligilactobacillus salivarius]
MRSRFKRVSKFSFIFLSVLIIASLIDSSLSILLPTCTFTIFFDKFLSTGISPLLIFFFGLGMSEGDKINDEINK